MASTSTLPASPAETRRIIPTRPLSTFEGFICGGLGACVAVTFSNPAEVAKTRMQLQGELVKDLKNKVYRNAPDVLVKTWRHEGIRGLQRGLGAAVSCQWDSRWQWVLTGRR
jgi:solute carrier family 25, member 34/35